MHSTNSPKSYKLFYTSLNGCQVWVHETHQGPERADNERIARFLADRGESVCLLPIGQQAGVKNPDAEIAGEIWEFKTNRVGTTNSLNNEIRRAHRQADRILIWVAVEMDLLQLENAIYNRVRQCPNLLRCRFIIANVLHEFSRGQIMDQTFRGKMGAKGEGGLT